MPPADKPTPPDKREQIHRAQLSLVAASLRAGVQYTAARAGSARPRPSAPDAAPHRTGRRSLSCASSADSPRLQ